MPEDNRKQNPEEPYKSKCQKYFALSYDYKLVCVDDKFSMLFKIYLGKDTVYNFINSIIGESKYCSEVMKKHFNKEIVMIKEDNENLQNGLEKYMRITINNVSFIVSFQFVSPLFDSLVKNLNIDDFKYLC